MTKLSISLLGTYALQLDGEPVTDLASGKVQALLTCLLLEPDHPHSREHLAGLLWPESTESGARNSLRTALYQLRALIGDHDADPPFLQIARDTLQLNPDAPIRSDVGTFSERFAEAKSHTHPDPLTCTQCTAALAEAVTLYRGDLLPTFSLDSAEFENWLVTRREALHRQALDALDRLAETHLARGEHDLALDYARRQIELEPWRESAHRQAMQALTLSGQRAAALMQYATCAHLLAAELGIEPEAATVSLYERIRRGDLAQEPVALSGELEADRAGAGPDTSTSGTAVTAGAPLPGPLDTPALEALRLAHTTLPADAVSPEVEAYMSSERRLVTVLVADVKGSTELAEALDVEEWVDTIGHLLEVLSAEVARYGGTVDQFRGDGLVAFFGVPVTHEDDAERAVLAALAMQVAVKRNPARSLEVTGGAGLDQGLEIRVGISSGEVIAGAVGDLKNHSERTAMGRTVALAARMEAAAEPGTVLVTEATYRLAVTGFEWQALGARFVKGIRDPVGLYRPLAPVAAPAEHDVGGLHAPLVGRRVELEAFAGAIARTRAGVGGIVTVVGEAGIGKSRLVSEMRSDPRNESTSVFQGPASNMGDREPSRSLTWVEGRWVSYAEDVAYSGWQEVLRQLLQLSEECNPTACAMLEAQIARIPTARGSELTPYLARLLALPVDETAAAQLDSLAAAGLLQNAIFRAVEDLFASFAQQTPLVLVLEDLHWADQASLALLGHLMAVTDQAPLLLVVVMRPVRSHGSWQIQARAMREYSHRHTDIWLGPLSPEESGALVRHLLADKGVEPEERGLLQRVQERAEGNPFFAAEMVRSYLDQGADAEGVPSTVQGVLMSRIDRLPATARQVLQLAAVIGRLFRYQLLADIVANPEAGGRGPDGSMLDAALLRLVRAQLIREHVAAPGPIAYDGVERAYIFDHQLTLEAAYGSLLQRKRRVLHGRVAETLVRLYPEEVESHLGVLAHHWERADNPERAVTYLHGAGEQAAAQYANDAAVGYFTRALRLAREGDLRTRYELLLARERVHDRQGAYEAQAVDLAVLRQVAVPLGFAAQAETAVLEARWALARGHFAAASRGAEAVVTLARRAGDLKSEAAAYCVWANALRQQQNAQLDQARAHAEQALKLAQAAKGRRLEIECLLALAYIAMEQDECGIAREALEAGLRLSREISDPAGEGWIEYFVSHLATIEGDMDQVRTHGDEALRISRELGDRNLELNALNHLSWAALWQGRYGAARANLEPQPGLAHEIGSTGFEIMALTMWGQLLRTLGAYERAQAYLERATAIPVESITLTVRVWALVELAVLRLWGGEELVARAHAEKALEVIAAREDVYYYHFLPSLRVLALTTVGHTYLRTGDPATAEASYQSAVAERLKTATPAITMEARAGLAEALMAQGKTQAALREAEAMAAFVEAEIVLSMWDPLRIYLSCYRVLSAHGDPRADEVLISGHRVLMARAATIDDEPLRRSYLENVGTNRELMAAYWRRTESRAL